MIRNNKLSYLTAQLPWYSFEIVRTSTSSLVTSVLITLVSYQTAAIVSDVVLGFKKRHEAKLKYFAMIILTRYLSSPLSVLNSILRKDWLTRLYYNGEIPRDTAISRDPEPIKIKTVLTMLVLLTVTPLIDVVLLALAMSRTHVLDFDEAGFGAVSLGASERSNALETTPYLSHCRKAPFEKRSSDNLDVSFLLCETPLLPEAEDINVTGVEIVIVDGYMISTRVILQGIAVLATKSARMQTIEGNYVVKATMGKSSSGLLVQTALEQFSGYCGATNITGTVPPKRSDQFTTQIQLLESVAISCNILSKDSTERIEILGKITSALRERVTLVRSDMMLVRKESDVHGAFSEERSIMLLHRTQKNASLFALIISVVLLLSLRFIVRMTIASDVEEGLLGCIRDQLPESSVASSLKAGEQRISFRRKYQVGDHGYYGMMQKQLPEVERFEKAIVGAVDVLEPNEPDVC